MYILAGVWQIQVLLSGIFWIFNTSDLQVVESADAEPTDKKG